MIQVARLAPDRLISKASRKGNYTVQKNYEVLSQQAHEPSKRNAPMDFPWTEF